MTVETKIDALTSAVADLAKAVAAIPTSPTGVDLSTLATAADVAALGTKLDGLIATVGTEAPASTEPATAA